MSTLSAARAVLEADATLNATATGGIWDASELGPHGFNFTSNPEAYDSNGIIKPVIVIKTRSSMPDGVLQDDANQYQSVVEMLELWFYQDSGYSAIDTMRDRCYALLHARPLTGTFAVRWAGDVRGQRDEDLDANVERSDYRVNLRKSV